MPSKYLIAGRLVFLIVLCLFLVWDSMIFEFEVFVPVLICFFLSLGVAFLSNKLIKGPIIVYSVIMFLSFLAALVIFLEIVTGLIIRPEEIGYIAVVTLGAVASEYIFLRSYARSGQTAPGDAANRGEPTELATILDGVDRGAQFQAHEFYRRAHALEKVARTLLFFIFCILVSSALFIVFANQITEIQGRFQQMLSAAEQRKSLIEREITRLNEERFELMQYDEPPAGEDSKALSDGQDESRQTIDQQLAFIGERIRRYESDLEQQNAYINEIRSAAISDMASQNDVPLANSLLATGITRFGVLAIAIFLVQILVSLYRYNTRMAAVYRAKADAIIMRDWDADGFERTSDVLTPKIEYGKTQPFVSERFLQQVTDVVDKALRRRQPQ